VIEGTPVTLNGSATDICDASLDYEWSEGGIVLGNNLTLVHTFPVGTHTVTLKATDDSGNAGTDNVLVTVKPSAGNTPGEVKGGAWYVDGGFRRNFMVEMKYVDGAFTSTLLRYLNHSNRLFMQATSISKFVISGTNVEIEGNCTVNGTGGYTFELVINDTNPDSISLTIKDAGGAVVDSTSGTAAGGDFVVTAY